MEVLTENRLESLVITILNSFLKKSESVNIEFYSELYEISKSKVNSQLENLRLNDKISISKLSEIESLTLNYLQRNLPKFFFVQSI